MSDYEQRQFDRVANAFLTGAFMSFVIWLPSGCAIGSHFAGLDAIKAGAAHWEIHPKTGRSIWVWHGTGSVEATP
jgi:hypothetical protein